VQARPRLSGACVQRPRSGCSVSVRAPLGSNSACVPPAAVGSFPRCSSRASINLCPGVPEEQQLSCNSGSFAVDDLQYSTPEFDPSSIRCKLQLAQKLGLSQNARIEALHGNSGGQNQGMWTMCDGSRPLMLKLVGCQRKYPTLPTETENFMKLAREYPNLVHDRDVSFPLKIFHCRGPTGQNTHDLIAMYKAPGGSFMDVITKKSFSRQIPDLMGNFEAAGLFLAKIHNKYGLQHSDFQPSNLFFDEASGQFTMIDIADLSPRGASGVQETDVQHFCEGVRLLVGCHGNAGNQIHTESVRRFQAGYTRLRATPI